MARKVSTRRGALTSVEVCAGAGGQALGLEQAGFEHLALVELDGAACQTLRYNRPDWRVLEADLCTVTGEFLGAHCVDLLAGGVPCPPFSIAGKQLGKDDERDLFPEVVRLAGELRPRALMIENVKGLLQKRFDAYRAEILAELAELGFVGEWRLLQAADFGVPQLRPRSLLVAMSAADWAHFEWPEATTPVPITVGEALYPLMAESGWQGAEDWSKRAADVAPTLVGGSKKHGGADLGPTRAKAAWRTMGVDGLGVADAPPGPDFVGLPRLTVEMAAAVQGFPREWKFQGRKTAAYRQVGNAFPPPVARAVGGAIRDALVAATRSVAS